MVSETLPVPVRVRVVERWLGDDLAWDDPGLRQPQPKVRC